MKKKYNNYKEFGLALKKQATSKNNYTVNKYKDYHIHRMNRLEFMIRLEQAKLKDWELKHPQPCTEDDLFADQFLPEYNELRNKAIEDIRDLIVSIYCKLTIYGRYKTANGFIYKKIGYVKDYGGGHMINHISNRCKLITEARKIIIQEKSNNSKLICGLLKDHKNQYGRIILPILLLILNQAEGYAF